MMRSVILAALAVAESRMFLQRQEVLQDVPSKLPQQHARAATGASGCTPETQYLMAGATVVYSNLLGFGPDLGQPESLVYGDVFPHAAMTIDLEVTATPFYEPKDNAKNGINSYYGNINFLCGTNTTLTFKFYDRLTGQPSIPGPFWFTVYDFDQQDNGKAAEIVTMTDYMDVSYVVDGDVNRSGDTWISTQYGKEDDNPADPRNLSEAQINKTVSYLIGSPTFSVEVQTGAGYKGRNLLFAGANNLVCPPQASCSSFICPEGFQSYNDSSLMCAGTVCDSAVDMSTCCEHVEEASCTGEEMFKMAVDSIVHSNLGGLGPNTTAESSLVFSNVFPNMPTLVDLVVTNLTEYIPANVDNNGMNGELAQINMAAGSNTKFEFKFVDRSTGELAELAPYYFSVFDFDSQKELNACESMTLEGFTQFVLTNTTQIVVDPETYNFSASEYGTQSDNPSDPLLLTSYQKDKSVAFVMKAAAVFNVSFAATSGSSGRNFLFGGVSSVICPDQAPCSTFTCPAGYTNTSGTESCAGNPCTDADLLTCCEPAVPDCNIEDHLMFSDSVGSLIYSNLGGQGPDFDMPEAIYLGDVFPLRPGDIIDMVISTTDAHYLAKNSSKNVVYGSFLNINFKGGTNATLNFTLLNRSTGELAQLPPYYTTVFDFDEQSTPGKGQESVTLPADVEFQLTQTTVIATEADGDSIVFHSTTYGNEADNPSAPLNLTQAQMDKSLSLKYDTPSFSFLYSVSAGSSGRNMLLAGPSDATCPGLALCTSLQCPEGFAYTEYADQLYCAGSECTNVDVTTCCIEMPTQPCSETELEGMRWEVVHSNLGGHGPDAGEPNMRLANVLPYLSDGTTVDAVIEVVHGAYVPNKAEKNGQDGVFLNINMNCDLHVTYRMSFFDNATGSPYTVPAFYFTFTDLDEESDGGGKETMSVFDTEIYHWNVSLTTQVEVTSVNGTTSFASTVYGNGKDNPTGPRTLTQEQMDKSVTALIKPTSSFRFKADLGACSKGRNILIGGPSSITCENRAACSELTCPVGFTPKEEALVCAGPVCGNQDVYSCCDFTG